MGKKIVYEKDGKIITESIDPNQREEIYLKRFPGSIISLEMPESSGKFVNALNLKDDILTVNMVKAREIHKDNLRNQRLVMFSKLDQLFLEGLSQDKDTTVIEDRQKYLRNITEHPGIEAAKTCTELIEVQIEDWNPPAVKRLPRLL